MQTHVCNLRIVRETKCTSGVLSLLILDCLSKNRIPNNSREGTLRGYKTSNCAPRLASIVLWPRNMVARHRCRLIARLGGGVFVFLRRCSTILKLTKSLELHCTPVDTRRGRAQTVYEHEAGKCQTSGVRAPPPPRPTLDLPTTRSICSRTNVISANRCWSVARCDGQSMFFRPFSCVMCAFFLINPCPSIIYTIAVLHMWMD